MVDIEEAEDSPFSLLVQLRTSILPRVVQTARAAVKRPLLELDPAVKRPLLELEAGANVRKQRKLAETPRESDSSSEDEDGILGAEDPKSWLLSLAAEGFHRRVVESFQLHAQSLVKDADLMHCVLTSAVLCEKSEEAIEIFTDLQKRGHLHCLDVRCLGLLAQSFARAGRLHDILALVTATTWGLPDTARARDTSHALVIDAVTRNGNVECALQMCRALGDRGYKIKPEVFVELVVHACEVRSLHAATEAFANLSDNDKRCHPEAFYAMVRSCSSASSSVDMTRALLLAEEHRAICGEDLPLWLQRLLTTAMVKSGTSMENLELHVRRCLVGDGDENTNTCNALLQDCLQHRPEKFHSLFQLMFQDMTSDTCELRPNAISFKMAIIAASTVASASQLKALWDACRGDTSIMSMTEYQHFQEGFYRAQLFNECVLVSKEMEALFGGAHLDAACSYRHLASLAKMGQGEAALALVQAWPGGSAPSCLLSIVLAECPARTGLRVLVDLFDLPNSSASDKLALCAVVLEVSSKESNSTVGGEIIEMMSAGGLLTRDVRESSLMQHFLPLKTDAGLE